MRQTTPKIRSIELRYWKERQYPNLERSDFSKMECVQENSESDLSRLTRYFAARSEHFRFLENLYRDMDPANVSADEEASKIMSRQHNLDFCREENVSDISD